MLCANCGKNDAVIMELCLDCFSKKHNKYHSGITFEQFRDQYLRYSDEGLFWADDVLLDYAYYQDEHRFEPRLCGEIPGTYTEEHNKLKAWYSENFYRLLLEKIKDVAPHERFGSIEEFEKLFSTFYGRINLLGVKAVDRRVVNILLMRFLNRTFKRKLIEAPDKYPNPEIVRQSAALFDTGSGFFYLDLFFRLLRYDYIWDICEYINNNEIRQLLNDARYPGLTIAPWRHQQQAIDAWVDGGKHGVVEMATATGKTLVGMLAIEEVAKAGIRDGTRKTVIIACHARIILNQWRRELIDKMGILGNANESYDVSLQAGNVTIIFETVQSLSRRIKDYAADLLIVDEVHHLAGKKFREALHIKCNWQLGLTAWLGQKAARRRLIEQELGPINFKYTLHEALEDGIIPSFEWIVHPTYLDINEEDEFKRISHAIKKTFEYVRYDSRTIRQILEKDKEKYRNIIPPEDDVRGYSLSNIGEFIKILEIARLKGGIQLPDQWKTLQALILKRRLIINKSQPRLDRAEELAAQLGNKHHVIMFLMDIESCDKMAKTLEGVVDNVFVIHSEIKDDPIAVAARFRNAKNGVLIGAQMLNEGIDIKNADIGINVAFAKSEIQLIQRMGRVLRREGNKRPTFYQFVAIPDKEDYLDIIDAEEFADDLAWVESTGLKMGLDLTVEWDSDELINYRKEIEEFWRDHTGTSKIGTFNLDAAINEFSKTAITRIPEILELYETDEITNAQWDDIIRVAHSLIDEAGKFSNGRKKRHINISSAWYILILCNRKVAKLSALFIERASQLTVTEEHELPPLYLNKQGVICSDSLVNEDNESFVVDDDSDLAIFDTDENDDDLDYLNAEDVNADDEGNASADDMLPEFAKGMGITVNDLNSVTDEILQAMYAKLTTDMRMSTFSMANKGYACNELLNIQDSGGLYFITERDERGLSRIVYIGESSGSLSIAALENFLQDKDQNWMRFYIGEALLKRDSDSYLKTWNFRPKTEYGKNRLWSYDEDYQAEIEKRVTAYMKENFTFYFVEIPDSYRRKGIRMRLINSLKEDYAHETYPSWLGSCLGKIGDGKMWIAGSDNYGTVDEEDMTYLFECAGFNEEEALRAILANYAKQMREKETNQL